MDKKNSLFYLYTVSFLTKIVNLKHNCRQRYKKNHHHYYVFNILYNNAYKMVKIIYDKNLSIQWYQDEGFRLDSTIYILIAIIC